MTDKSHLFHERGGDTPIRLLSVVDVGNMMNALKRESANIASVNRFANGMVMTFDQFGNQMPAFQGKATDILPLLEVIGWTGEVEWAGLKP